jgi:hypothetical protein
MNSPTRGFLTSIRIQVHNQGYLAGFRVQVSPRALFRILLPKSRLVRIGHMGGRRGQATFFGFRKSCLQPDLQHPEAADAGGIPCRGNSLPTAPPVRHPVGEPHGSGRSPPPWIGGVAHGYEPIGGVGHNANRRGESDHDSPAGPGPHGDHGERRAITVTPAQARLGNWGMSVPAESATRIEPRGQNGQTGLGTAQLPRWLG